LNKRLLAILLGLVVVAGLAIAVALARRGEVTVNMDWTVGDSCQDAVLIGAAGSGQRDDEPVAGPQVESVVSGFTAQLTEHASSAIDVGVMALDYPAPGILEGTLLGFLGDSMVDSIAEGRATLLSAIRTTSERCPTTSLYLIGYSQGASVVHTTVSEIPAKYRESVAGVVVIADPNRDADDPYTEHYTTELDPAVEAVTTPHTRDGVFGALPTPAWLEGSFYSACARRDAVCNSSLTDVLATDSAHTDESYHDLGPYMGKLLADGFLDR